METTTLPPRGKLTLRYYLLQIGFWGGIGCFTGFQSVIVLDRGFTSADVGVFVAVCNMAGILFQPQLGPGRTATRRSPSSASSSAAS